MALDSLDTDIQDGSNLFIASTVSHKDDDLLFSIGKSG